MKSKRGEYRREAKHLKQAPTTWYTYAAAAFIQ